LAPGSFSEVNSEHGVTSGVRRSVRSWTTAGGLLGRVVVRTRNGSVMTREILVVSSDHSLSHHVEKSVRLGAVSGRCHLRMV
jgi:hypothetical protein